MTRKEMTKQNLSENIGVISCASSMITTRDLSPCSTLVRSTSSKRRFALVRENKGSSPR